MMMLTTGRIITLASFPAEKREVYQRLRNIYNGAYDMTLNRLANITKEQAVKIVQIELCKYVIIVGNRLRCEAIQEKLQQVTNGPIYKEIVAIMGEGLLEELEPISEYLRSELRSPDEENALLSSNIAQLNQAVKLLHDRFESLGLSQQKIIKHHVTMAADLRILVGKFKDLEEQLNQRQEEIVARLTSIEQQTNANAASLENLPARALNFDSLSAQVTGNSEKIDKLIRIVSLLEQKVSPLDSFEEFKQETNERLNHVDTRLDHMGTRLSHVEDQLNVMKDQLSTMMGMLQCVLKNNLSTQANGNHQEHAPGLFQ